MEAHNQYSVPSGPGMPDWLKVLLTVVLATGIAFGGMAFYRKSQKKGGEAKTAATEQTPPAFKGEILRDLDPEGAAALNAMANRANGSGKDGPAGVLDEKILRALTDAMFEVQSASKGYEELRQKLNLDSALDLSGIKTREDIARNRDAAREFLKANAALHDSLGNLQTRFREKLEQEGISGPQLAAYTEAASTAFERALPTQQRVQASHAAMGRIWIELCDLLEGEWGKWRLKDGSPDFDSEEAAVKYTGLQQSFERATKSRLKAQGEFFARPR
jgi:hypothetical protein